ncbi:MAG: STAS-like domain-containing protein [Blastocatellia bacterium]|nr:STAS-like domain-containing protein [Blastocatellia bacterium]
MLGTRDVATPLRDRVEHALDSSTGAVGVDFCQLLVTQSFMDEFLGVMILRRGPSVLDRVIFRNCNEDVKAAIQLVVAVRTRDYRESVASG